MRLTHRLVVPFISDYVRRYNNSCLNPLRSGPLISPTRTNRPASRDTGYIRCCVMIRRVAVSVQRNYTGS